MQHSPGASYRVSMYVNPSPTHSLAPALASSLLADWTSCWAAEERALLAAVCAELMPPATVGACLALIKRERDLVGDLLA
jgi:hypothetical protein